MIELITTMVITVSSVLLFGYWFRYTCLLILSAKTTQNYAVNVAAANQLGFLDVQAQLRAQTSDLDALRDALNRDYAIVMRLVKQGSEVEKHMLGIDYRLMSVWYRVSRHFSPAAARRALEEMSEVVAHFANVMGEQAASSAAA